MLNQQQLLEGWPAPTDLCVGEKRIVLRSLVYPTAQNVGSLPNLQSKAAWKDSLQENLNCFCKYLTQVKGFWPHCNLCSNQHGLEHCGAEKHFKTVWYKVEGYPSLDFVVVRDHFWQTWQLPGGGIRFNHLDATVEVFCGDVPPPNSNTIPYGNYSPSASEWGSAPITLFSLPMQPPSDCVGTNGLSGKPSAATSIFSLAQPPPPGQPHPISSWSKEVELNDEDDWSNLCDECCGWGSKVLELNSSAPGRSGGHFKVAVHVKLEWDSGRPASPPSSSAASVSDPQPSPLVIALPPIAPPPMRPIVPSEPSSVGGAQNPPLFEGDRVIVNWYGQMHEATIFCFLDDDRVKVMFVEDNTAFDTTRDNIRRVDAA